MRTLVALLWCFAMAGGHLAAAPVGAVKGYVKDSTGAIVPAATVVLVSEETHLSQRARADDGGYFQFLQLPPGRYQLTAEAGGFRKTSIRDVLVLVNQIVSLDVQLEVGQITEVVEVAGGVVTLIEPDKSSTGVIMDLTMVKNLPQAGRQFLDLARLAPGVVLDAPGTQAGGFSGALPTRAVEQFSARRYQQQRSASERSVKTELA